MATYFFGINYGEGLQSVTQSASTTSKDIEVAINTTANVPTKNDLLVALENLEAAITQSGKNW
jgi:hypothetical protein